MEKAPSFSYSSINSLYGSIDLILLDSKIAKPNDNNIKPIPIMTSPNTGILNVHLTNPKLIIIKFINGFWVKYDTTEKIITDKIIEGIKLNVVCNIKFFDV